MSCGGGSRGGLDQALLWLWCRLAAVALIWPLAWELPHAVGVALKRKKKVPHYCKTQLWWKGTHFTFMALEWFQELRTKTVYDNKRCSHCTYCSGNYKGCGHCEPKDKKGRPNIDEKYILVIWMIEYILLTNRSITGKEDTQSNYSMLQVIARKRWPSQGKL